jgi:hypothetical protein
MRLLNVRSLELEEFVGEVNAGIPEYAILSHTWDKEEVSYADFMKGESFRSKKKGYRRSVALAGGRIPKDFSTFGSIHAAWIRVQARSCPRRSILCSTGTGMQLSVVHT